MVDADLNRLKKCMILMMRIDCWHTFWKGVGDVKGWWGYCSWWFEEGIWKLEDVVLFCSNTVVEKDTEGDCGWFWQGVDDVDDEWGDCCGVWWFEKIFCVGITGGFW